MIATSQQTPLASVTKGGSRQHTGLQVCNRGEMMFRELTGISIFPLLKFMMRRDGGSPRISLFNSSMEQSPAYLPVVIYKSTQQCNMHSPTCRTEQVGRLPEVEGKARPAQPSIPTVASAPSRESVQRSDARRSPPFGLAVFDYFSLIGIVQRKMTSFAACTLPLFAQPFLRGGQLS